MIGNKIANKITSIGKPKEKEKTKGIEEVYIPPEKRQQIIDDLKLIEHHCIKMEFQKIAIFLTQRLTIKNCQDLLLKSGLKFMINQEEITMLTKKSESKRQC